MNYQNNYDNGPAGRWHGEGQFQEEHNYDRYGRSSYRQDDHLNADYNYYGELEQNQSRQYNPTWEREPQQQFASQSSYFSDQNQGRSGNFGSPNNHHRLGNQRSRSDRYYGSEGNYGLVPDYRNGNSRNTGYNANRNLLGRSMQPTADFENQNGYRSDYNYRDAEYDASMQDLNTSTNFTPAHRPFEQHFNAYGANDQNNMYWSDRYGNNDR